jgi:hypothetical protein
LPPRGGYSHWHAAPRGGMVFVWDDRAGCDVHPRQLFR